jgi:prevent-host-death family protein
MKSDKQQVVSTVEVRKHLSGLLGRVAYGGETILITQRGRPMAKLVPLNAEEQGDHLADFQGWLEEDDPFFDLIDKVVLARSTHRPRIFSSDDEQDQALKNMKSQAARSGNGN